MYLLLLILLGGGSSYLYFRKYDIGDLMMVIIRLYERINRLLIKPVNKYLESSEDMTEIYINNIRCKIDDISNCNSKDTIEILWKGRYRAIYNGRLNVTEYVCPFDKVSEKNNILYANLHKNGEVIDVTKRIEEYSGPNGDFFESDMIIYNYPSCFYDKERKLMLETDEDFILVMDKRGNEAKLKKN